jgi:hypothetical protein
MAPTSTPTICSRSHPGCDAKPKYRDARPGTDRDMEYDDFLASAEAALPDGPVIDLDARWEPFKVVHRRVAR